MIVIGKENKGSSLPRFPKGEGDMQKKASEDCTRFRECQLPKNRAVQFGCQIHVVGEALVFCPISIAVCLRSYVRNCSGRTWIGRAAADSAAVCGEKCGEMAASGPDLPASILTTQL